MKRTIALIALAAAAACGSRTSHLESGQATPTLGQDARPSLAGTAIPLASSTTRPPIASTTATPMPAPTDQQGRAATKAEPTPVIPRPGRYTIHVSGTRSAGSTGQPQPFEGDGTLDVTVSGSDVTLDTDSPEGTEHLETRHTSRGVLLRRARIEQAALTFDAAFTPPQLIIRSPIRVGDSWTNEWSAGDTSGISRFTVVRSQKMQGLGRSWRTFVIENRTTTSGDAEGTTTTTSWYSPELGLDLKRTSEMQGRYRGVPFSQRSERVITAAPARS